MTLSSRIKVRLAAALGIAALSAGVVGAVQSPAAAGTRPWTNGHQAPAKRASELLAEMTLAEKVQMLHGVDTSVSPVDTVGYIPPIKRLGVPAVTMTDGPAGVRNGRKATELPAPISEAASWDPTVAKAYGEVVGGDARDLGQDQLFGPGMNIARVPTNGRNFEYFSEDPLLSGTIAGANVRGVQKEGTIATLKHYVANNQETDRTTISANVDDRTLHEIYEKNFGIAVADGHPGSVMCSYNRINDTYACENAATLITALRKQFGFDGYVVSDYPATHDTTDVKNGLNIELPTGVHLTLPAVQDALAAHTITMVDIDRRVRETLTVLFRFGLFDRSHTVTPIDEDVDNAVAQQIDERSAVLLKNDGALPVPTSTKDIAVIGTTAKTSAQGGGSSQVDPLSVDNAYDAIVARAGSSGNIAYDDGTDPTSAAQTASSAQLALVFVQDSSSEGSDRPTLALSGNQDALVSAVAAANPHTVVVLETGAPALMPWLSKVQGVLEAWYPGARGGAAIARLLWGDVNPSGKLPQTWPVSDDQVPASTDQQYPGVGGEETYSEGIDVGYRWYDDHAETPLFPFGYGLSYTHFAYSGLKLSHRSGTSRNNVTVALDVKNTGARSGSEVVQVYASKPHSLASTPPRELATFGKVTLKPGQTKRVRLTVLARELSYWDSGAQAFTVQDGNYTISAGGSSRVLPLHATYRVTRSDGPVRIAATSDAGASTPAGSSFTVDANLHNLSDYTDEHAAISVQAPSGWQVTALTPASFGSIAPGGTASAQFHVTVPSSTHGGTDQVTVSSSGTVHGRPATSQQTLAITVPFASFAAAMDTVGVTDDSDAGPGNFDPGGYSFSAQHHAATGVTPGGKVNVGSSSITFPAQAPGTPDAVTARGQVVTLGAQTAHLVLVGAATFNEISAPIVVTYSDGSTDTVTVDFADWYSNSAAGTSRIVATSEWNQPPGGIGAHDVSIYGQIAAVDNSKTIKTITLPNNANLHFFTAGPDES